MDEEAAEKQEPFDPWALPEFNDVGPRWNGKILAHVYVILKYCVFLILAYFAFTCEQNSMAMES